jgi:hypothetical protein
MNSSLDIALDQLSNLNYDVELSECKITSFQRLCFYYSLIFTNTSVGCFVLVVDDLVELESGISSTADLMVKSP